MGNGLTTELPGLNIDPNSVVVAGYSCGSQLATNMLIIESDDIKGAAMFNGFLTYGGWIDGADLTAEQITERVNLINTNYEAGKIDNPANLGTAPSYVFRGDQDIFEQKPQADLLKAFANHPSLVQYVVDSTMGHDFTDTQFRDSLNSIYVTLLGG